MSIHTYMRLLNQLFRSEGIAHQVDYARAVSWQHTEPSPIAAFKAIRVVYGI